MNRKKPQKLRRKTTHAYACVGSHGLPFCCVVTRKAELQGRFEIFDTYEAALRMALSPYHVRRVKILVEQEPAIVE